MTCFFLVSLLLDVFFSPFLMSAVYWFLLTLFCWSGNKNLFSYERQSNLTIIAICQCCAHFISSWNEINKKANHIRLSQLNQLSIQCCTAHYSIRLCFLSFLFQSIEWNKIWIKLFWFYFTLLSIKIEIVIWRDNVQIKDKSRVNYFRFILTLVCVCVCMCNVCLFGFS